MSGPEALTPAGLADHVRRPVLVALGGATMDAALVVGMDPLEGPADKSAIGHAGFAPWGAWPPGLDGLQQAAIAGGPSFAAAPAGDGVYSLLFERNDQASGLAYDWAVDVSQKAAPKDLPSNDAVALFVSTEGSRHLVGYEEGQGKGRALAVALFEADAIGAAGFALACSNEPIVADAMPMGDHFVMAAAQNPPFANCPPSDDDGPATDLLLFDVSPDGMFTMTSPVSGTAGIVRLKLVPNVGGGWLLFERAGQDKTTQPVAARRLGSDGALADDGFDAIPGGRRLWTAAAWNDGLAVAWLEDRGPSAPSITLTILDASGAQIASTTFTPQNGFVEGPLTLLANPDTREIVLGWSAETIKEEGARVHLVRFSCVGGA
jgi:hypothetical protein